MRIVVPEEAGPLLDATMERTLWRSLVIHDADADESYLMGVDGARVALPAYSTNAVDAHRVVAFMQQRGWTLSIKHELEGTPRFVALFGKPDGRSYRYVEAPTMPHAICIAALWALTGTNVGS